MGKEIKLGGVKFYSTSPNKKTGEPANLTAGTTVRNLKFLGSVEATASKYPNRLNHEFLEGDNTAVFNGCGMLDSLVKKLVKGDIVDITYKGKEPCPFGVNKGTETHTYSISYSDGVPAVNNAPQASVAAEEDTF